MKDRSAKGQLYPIVSVDNFMLLLFACGMILLGSTYQKLMISVYSTESWHFFEHIMKVLMNHFGHHKLDRSLPRDLFFNTVRCMPEELIFYIVNGDCPSTELIMFRLWSIWLLTVFVHMFVSRREARRNPNTWSCFVIFFVTSFGL